MNPNIYSPSQHEQDQQDQGLMSQVSRLVATMLMPVSTLVRLSSVSLAVVILALLFSISLWAQETADDGATTDDAATTEEGGDESSGPNPEEINRDGGVLFEQYVIDDFENADLWYGGMWVDDGLIQVRKVFGKPAELEGGEGENNYSLGAKISFFRRSFSYAAINPPRDVIVPGLTERLSVWVQGRGIPHQLYAVIRDFEGKIYNVPFGDLNFTGWKKMEAIIPSHIVQQNNAFSTYYRRQGITFVSFLVEFDQQEALGTYFIYFDKLEAKSNVYLYEEQVKNEQLADEERIDPIDNW